MSNGRQVCARMLMLRANLIFNSHFRDLCHDSWMNLRRSPIFGCICPNNHMKKRCDRIFSMVNHNPCVGKSVTLAASVLSHFPISNNQSPANEQAIYVSFNWKSSQCLRFYVIIWRCKMKLKRINSLFGSMLVRFGKTLNSSSQTITVHQAVQIKVQHVYKRDSVTTNAIYCKCCMASVL